MVRITIPDILTLSRLPLGGIILFLAYTDRKIEAMAVLGLMAFTDWLDGYLAIKLNQKTDFGRVLDPAVDYFLVCTLIPSMIFLRTKNEYALLLSPIIFALGIYYFRKLIPKKDMLGTPLGRPFMTIAVLACYISLIMDFYWKYFLAAAALLWAANTLLFLQGKYRKKN